MPLIRRLPAAALGVLLAGAAVAQQPGKPGPARGTVLAAQAGDLACYLTIRDEAGQAADWMAGFELCEPGAARPGQAYAIAWEEGRVLHPDCQGDAACGRSLQVFLAVGLRPLPR